MGDRSRVAKLWADGLSDPSEERVAALGAALAEEVRTVSPVGTTVGKEAVLASFGRSQLAPFFARGSWSEPELDGDAVSVTCKFPPSAPVGGATVRITFDSQDHIAQVETTLIPAPPAVATDLKITDAMAEAVNGALLNGTPVVVAYVDRDGRPHMSLRGSVQVFDPEHLAIWVRNPEGGLLAAIPGNPHLALFYRDPAKRAFYQFQGRARANASDEVRDRVYTNTAEPERNLDPQRKGVAVVVELDRVEGRDANGAVLMERGHAGR